MRDIEFEARRLLKSPEDILPCFKHPKIINLAQEYGRSLTEQLQVTPSGKLLGRQEVVMKVVPKVLQGFWPPPPTTSFKMTFQQLSEMAVEVTKAVLDCVTTSLSSTQHQITFCRSRGRSEAVWSCLSRRKHFQNIYFLCRHIQTARNNIKN